MEKNKQDAIGRRRSYDEAFKRDAVRLAAEEGSRSRHPRWQPAGADSECRRL
jgi:transposase-like protein